MVDQVENRQAETSAEKYVRPEVPELSEPPAESLRTRKDDTESATEKEGSDAKRADTAQKDIELPVRGDASASKELPAFELAQGMDLFLPDVKIPTSDAPEGTKVRKADTTAESDQNPVGEKGDASAKPEVGVQRNSQNQISSINYPDGRSRSFKYDASGALTEFTEKGEDGEKTFTSKDGKWFRKVGNMELPMDSSFSLRDNGEFLVRSSPDHPVQVDRPDGTVAVEKPEPKTDGTKTSPEVKPGGDGAKVEPKDLVELERDAHGNITSARLPGGSSRTFKYDESGEQLLQIKDTLKTSSGERTEEWTRQADPSGGFGDGFVKSSPAGSSEVRKDIKVGDKGAYEYTDSKGERKVSELAERGEAKAETPWKADIQKDEQGRYKFIENEKFRRDYTYFEGTNKIKSYHVVDKESGESATWSRNSPDERQFTGVSGRGVTEIMHGEFSVTDDGVHVVARDGKTPYVFLGNGIEATVNVDKSGNISAIEGSNHCYVRRTDGSTISYTDRSRSQISVYDHQNGQRVTWSKGSDGNWTSDSNYQGDSWKDVSFNEKGELTFTDAENNKRTKTLEGQEIVQKADGSKLVFDLDGNLQRVIHGDTERTFTREDGKVTGVSEVNEKGERKAIFPPPLGDGQTIEDAKLGDDGEFTYKVKNSDGKIAKAVTESSNGNTLEHDAEGSIRSVSRPNGFNRSFEYSGEGDSKQLVQVKDTRQTSNGEKTTTWTRNALPSGGFSDEFHSSTENGKERPVRNIGNILADGSYEYTTEDQKPGDKPRIQRLSGGDGFFSDTVEDAHFNLLETMEQHMDEPRLKRMDEMMKAFETRMTERAEARKLAGVTSPEEIDKDVAQTVSRTFDNIAQMVASGDSNTFYNQEERTFLAENFMFHAQDPSTSDQGPSRGGDNDGHGTCWIQSAHIWAMTQRTDHMADLLKQVSLTGKYTTKNGGEKGNGPKTIEFSKEYLSFPRGKQETGWSISKATDMWDRQPNMISQCDGDRSPVGKIFDYVLPVIGGRPQIPSRMDGGTYDSFNQPGNRWYVGNAEIMSMVTGDKPCDVSKGSYSEGHLIDGNIRKTLLEKGTVLNYSPGHLKSMHLRKLDDQWVIMQDDQHGESDDRIIARISDIERWARGDQSAERSVNERIAHRKYKLETDHTIVGTITPSPDSNSFQQYNSSSPQQQYQTAQYSSYRRWR